MDGRAGFLAKYALFFAMISLTKQINFLQKTPLAGTPRGDMAYRHCNLQIQGEPQGDLHGPVSARQLPRQVS